MKWRVQQEQSGQKLVSFLKDNLTTSFSSRHIKQLIELGRCKVNGKVERFASFQVAKGDTVFFLQDKSNSCENKLIAKNNTTNITILFSDDHFLAIDKPSRIASDDPKLVNAISKESKSLILVHRLDKETTGVLLFAKSKEAFLKMVELFKKGEVEKTYLAIVDGKVLSKQGKVENQMGKLSLYQGQTLWGVVKEGLKALTFWERVSFSNQASLMVCYPKTGRTHQLRVHMSGIGHPILGDYQYGKSFKCSFKPDRILLHALILSFNHPFIEKKVVINSPQPSDFKEAIEKLKL